MSNWIKSVCKGTTAPPSTSVTVTVTGAVTALQGSIIVAVAYGNGSGISVSSVTDSQSNTYVMDVRVDTTATGGRGLELWRCQDPAALGTSDTITATMVGGSCDHGINLIADLYTRLASAPTVTAQGSSPSGTTSSISITPLATDAVAIAAAAFNNTETSETVGAPFTIATSNPSTVTNTITCATAWDDNPGSSSITATFTGSPTAHTNCNLAATYQTSTVVLTTPNLALGAPALASVGGGPVSTSLTTPNLALAAPLLTPITAPSPVQFEYVASNGAGGVTSFSPTCIASTPKGATLVLAVATAVPVNSVTDSGGNVYAPVTSNGNLSIWQAVNCAALTNAVSTVTVSLAFAGVNGIDVVGVAFPSGWIFDSAVTNGQGTLAVAGSVNYPALAYYNEAIITFAWDLSNSTIQLSNPALSLGPAIGGNSAGWLTAGVSSPLDDEANTLAATWFPTTGAAYDAVISSQSPVAWWKLNESVGAGSVADSSGNGNTGTPVNVTLGSQALAAPNTSGAFNGTSSKVTTSYNPSGFTALSLSCLVNLQGLVQPLMSGLVGNSFPTVGGHGGFFLQLSPGAGGQMYLSVNMGNGTTSSGVASTTPVPATGVTHLACTWNGTTITLYQNGVSVGTVAFSGTIPAGTNNMTLGADAPAGNDWLNGLLGEVAIFNTALTGAQVLAQYNAVGSPWAMCSIAYRIIPQALLQGPVAPPQFPTPLYTFLATDLVTNAILGELPLNSVQFDAQLNNAGNLTANANLDDPRIDNNVFIGATTPGRTALWCYRNNTIVWGGILWTRQWTSTGKSFTFSGQTFESYAKRRYARSWLGTGKKVYKNTGQIGIINALWHFMQDVNEGSIGVRTLRPDDFPANDVQRNLTINGFDLSLSFDDIIQSLIQLDDGPDYTIVWQTDANGLPIKQLVLAQTIGNPIGTTDLVVDYPGTIKDYTYIEDASSGANQWWTAGAGTGASAVVGVATSQASLNAGWPLIENVDTESITTVNNSQATVNKFARADLNHFPMPFVTHAVDLFSSQGPQFGSYGLGDRATFNVVDPRFPNGLQFSVRVIGWSVTLPDTGSGPEQVQLVFDEQTTPGPNTG